MPTLESLSTLFYISVIIRDHVDRAVIISSVKNMSKT